jgi:uncharacterized protein (TIGR03083 family)
VVVQTLGWQEVVTALGDEYDPLDEIITSLDADELLEPSGCRGWTNADLIFHMLLDAQRALVTFNSPAAGPPDRDFVNYWRSFDASDDDAKAHARFVRISAAAHQNLTTISSRWHMTVRAVMRNAPHTRESEFVATQGHVLTVTDFIATLIVEAVVHHLDLLANLEHKAGPAPAALAVTTRTLEGLMGKPRPSFWDEVTLILKSTGRRPLSDDERRALGAAGDSFPVFS